MARLKAESSQRMNAHATSDPQAVLYGGSSIDTRGDKRRVLISTLYPLGGNYGGLLQAYALQKVITQMGFQAATINSTERLERTKFLPRLARAYALQTTTNTPAIVPMTAKQRQVVWEENLDFIDRNVHTVDIFRMNSRSRAKFLEGLYAVVVGSDQVWRRAYADIPRQLLHYVKDPDILRLSYAASFGTGDLDQYPSRLLKRTARWAQEFTAISVREDEGIDFVRQNWKLDAVRNVDPTMLLSASDYGELVARKDSFLESYEGHIFSYVLDEGPQVAGIISRACEITGLPAKHILPGSSPAGSKGPAGKRPLPSVEQWLRGIATASLVVTDSFHGTVFSILFNRPFITLGNKSRGSSRLSSLLGTFGLESRFVDSPERLTDFDLGGLDWRAANTTLQLERIRSMDYLTEHLARTPSGER